MTNEQASSTNLNPIDWGYELIGMKNGQRPSHYDELTTASGYFETCAVGEALQDMGEDPKDWVKLTPEIRSLGCTFCGYICQKSWAKARACRLTIRRAIRRMLDE